MASESFSRNGTSKPRVWLSQKLIDSAIKPRAINRLMMHSRWQQARLLCCAIALLLLLSCASQSPLQCRPDNPPAPEVSLPETGHFLKRSLSRLTPNKTSTMQPNATNTSNFSGLF